MKKIVLYDADDGVEFLNENECMLYEKYAITFSTWSTVKIKSNFGKYSTYFFSV